MMTPSQLDTMFLSAGDTRRAVNSGAAFSKVSMLFNLSTLLTVIEETVGGAWERFSWGSSPCHCAHRDGTLGDRSERAITGEIEAKGAPGGRRPAPHSCECFQDRFEMSPD